MEITIDNISYWEDEYEKEMNSYYSIKQQCNHSNDVLSTWDRASKAWDRANEIKKAIDKFKKSIILEQYVK